MILTKIFYVKRHLDRNHKIGGYFHQSVFPAIQKFCQFMPDISYFRLITAEYKSKIQPNHKIFVRIETLCKNRAKYESRNNKENKHYGALSSPNRYFSEMKCLRKSNRHANWFELNFNRTNLRVRFGHIQLKDHIVPVIADNNIFMSATMKGHDQMNIDDIFFMKN